MNYLKESEAVKTQTVFTFYTTIDERIVDAIEGLEMLGNEKWVRGKAGDVTIQVYGPGSFTPGSIWKVCAERKYFPNGRIHSRMTFSNWAYQQEQMPELIEPVLACVGMVHMLLDIYTGCGLFVSPGDAETTHYKE